jgi:hypothetical protein
MLRSFVRALAGLGFRFVMLADVVVLNVVMYATMVLRLGLSQVGYGFTTPATRFSTMSSSRRRGVQPSFVVIL